MKKNPESCLIGAAPDLLAIAKESEMRVSILVDRGDLSPDARDEKITRDWLKRLRAAIAKAEGRS